MATLVYEIRLADERDRAVVEAECRKKFRGLDVRWVIHPPGVETTAFRPDAVGAGDEPKMGLRRDTQTGGPVVVEAVEDWLYPEEDE